MWSRGYEHHALVKLLMPTDCATPAGSQRYVVSDDFEYTNAKPNIHFAEHQHGPIFNLTFSNQPEGLQQFDQVCAILDAIKAHTASSWKPLASIAEVRQRHS
jgi:hypothetical protein